VNRNELGCFVGLYSVLAVAVILGEVIFVLLIRMELFYTQPWFDELEGQSRNDAMDFIDRILALAVWPLVAANLVGLALLWWAMWRRKESTP
jgi:nitrate reductase NapE component